MPWGYAIAAVGGLVAADMQSDAQKDAAKKQADAIEKSSGISQASVNASIMSMLNIAGPALADHFKINQNSIDLFNQGRISSGNLIASGVQNAMNTLSQGGQASINALLGLPADAPPTANSPDVDPTTSGPITSVAQPLPQQPQPGQVTTTVPTPDGGQQQVTLPTNPGANFTTPGDVEWGTPLVQPRPQRIGKPTQKDIDRPVMGGEPAALPVRNSDVGPQYAQTQQENKYLNAAFEGGGIGERGVRGSGQVGGGTLTGTGGIPIVGADTLGGGVFDAQFGERALNIPQAVIPQAPAGTTAGLAGAEQALTGGLGQARTDLGIGAGLGLQQLNKGFGQARQDIGQGRDFALNQIQRAMSQAGQGYEKAAQTALSGAQQGVGFMSPYMEAGTEALDPYLALSGVRGQEAFDAARLNDPAYQLALKSSEQALGRQAALTGTLGSGNIMSQLQENAQMQAAADIDRQLGRLRAITSAGQQAAGTAGGFATQGGIAAGGIQAQGAGQQADLGRMAAQFEMQTGQNLGQLASQLGISEAQLLTQLGQNLSGAELQTGAQRAGLREQAGINLANLIQQQTGQQAGMQTGLATDLSNLDQQTLANIINTMQQAAGTQLGSRLGLGQTIGNIGIGQGSQQAQYAQQLGAAQAAGVTNPLGNALNTFLGLYASGAFDKPASNNTNTNTNTQITNTGTNLYGTT